MAAELDNALYEDIYRHLICQIEGILDPVLSFEFSVRVSHNDGSISFRVPFWLPPPSPESLRWLTTAEEQQALRQAFAARLQRELKRFIPSQLREFLLERLDVERYKPPIPERLKRYLRGSAGRPEFDQPPLSRAEKRSFWKFGVQSTCSKTRSKSGRLRSEQIARLEATSGNLSILRKKAIWKNT